MEGQAVASNKHRLAGLIVSCLMCFLPAFASAQAFASRENPVPMGTLFGSGTSISLVAVEYYPDATAIVLETNTFNEPPRDGWQYVIIRVEFTFSSYDDEVFDLAVFDRIDGFVGPSNIGYTDGRCGVYPDDPSTLGEVFSGGTVEFNLCQPIPATEVDELLLYFTDLTRYFDDLSFYFDEDERFFFELNPTNAGEGTPVASPAT